MHLATEYFAGIGGFHKLDPLKMHMPDYDKI